MTPEAALEWRGGGGGQCVWGDGGSRAAAPNSTVVMATGLLSGLSMLSGMAAVAETAAGRRMSTLRDMAARPRPVDLRLVRLPGSRVRTSS